MSRFVMVWGNGRVDSEGIDPNLVQRLQEFVDSQRRSAPGTPCVIQVNNRYPLVATLYEQTAELIQNFETLEYTMRHAKGSFPALDANGGAS